MRVRRRLAGAVLALGLAVGMFLVVGVTARPPQAVSGPSGQGAVGAVTQTAGRQAAEDSVSGLQARLERLPRDDGAWAALGAAYVQQARLSADPTYYGKADGALRRSLALRRAGNAPALTGQAALAAARHDFPGALRLATAAKKINPYSAANQGVLVDALIELGRYDRAGTELQRMVDLKPGVPSYTRVSYYRELRGDLPGARRALEQALTMAYAPADAAYACYYLGELAFNAGDLATAAARYDEGLRRDATYLPLLAGRARVEAARGDTEGALRDYASVVERLPQPSYLIEYADLLASLGRHEEAARQYAVVDATEALFRSQGANVDLELALYDADHGRARAALSAAAAEYGRRRSVAVEDAYAWALHVNGRDREALTHVRAAQRLGTRSALFAYHRGMIERSLGHEDAARASLERSLGTNPYFSVLQAPRARQALAELGGTP